MKPQLRQYFPMWRATIYAKIYWPVSVEKTLKLLSQYPQAIIKRLSAVTQKHEAVGVTVWSKGSPKRRRGWTLLPSKQWERHEQWLVALPMSKLDDHCWCSTETIILVEATIIEKDITHVPSLKTFALIKHYLVFFLCSSLFWKTTQNINKAKLKQGGCFRSSFAQWTNSTIGPFSTKIK